LHTLKKFQLPPTKIFPGDFGSILGRCSIPKI